MTALADGLATSLVYQAVGKHTQTCTANERAHYVVQAMQQGWGGQQWHGGVTPLGLAQGWIRPYPMGMPQAGPLQLPPMVSRGPIQG